MDRSRWQRIARGASILGLVNLARLIAEGFTAGKLNLIYIVLVSGDWVLSGAAIFGGLGLIKGRRSAPATIIFLAGAWFVSAFGLSIWMWPYVLRGFGKDFVLLPRVVFYALILVSSPFAAVTMIRRREPEWPPRPRLIGWMILGMLSGAVYVGGLLLARH